MNFVFGVHEIWLTTICVLLGALYFVRKMRRKGKSPPGPVGIPLLGYLPFKGKHSPSTFHKLSKKYGPVLHIKLGLEDFVILNDYDSIHEALVKRADVFSGRPTFPITIESAAIGKQEGIATRDFDENCKAQRKFALMTLRSFGFGKRSMEDKVTEEVKCFAEMLHSKNGEPFNCQAAFATTVSNVICSIVLGSRFSYDDEVFSNMIEKLNRGFSSKKDAVGLSVINFLPKIRYLPPFSWIYKQFVDDFDYIEAILTKIVEEHKNTLEENESRDFIDEYLKEMQKRGDKDPSFNDKQLLQVIRDFFIAGTETTSSTLRWIVLLFAHRPDIQEKVAKEIDQVIGEATPSMKHREELPYTSAFLHEITRHRTLAPFAVPHKTTKDVNFRGYHIAKNTMVLPNLWAVHHDADYFENPMEFNPERFISEEGKFVPDKHVIPFSIGPRYCLGEQLARMELLLFLANIVQRFKVVPSTENPLPNFNDAVLGLAEVPHQFEVSFVVRQ